MNTDTIKLSTVLNWILVITIGLGGASFFIMVILLFGNYDEISKQRNQLEQQLRKTKTELYYCRYGRNN